MPQEVRRYIRNVGNKINTHYSTFPAILKQMPSQIFLLHGTQGKHDFLRIALYLTQNSWTGWAAIWTTMVSPETGYYIVPNHPLPWDALS